METYNTCTPDADQTLGDFDLISKLLIGETVCLCLDLRLHFLTRRQAIQVAVGLFGVLTIYQLHSSYVSLENMITKGGGAPIKDGGAKAVQSSRLVL